MKFELNDRKQLKVEDLMKKVCISPVSDLPWNDASFMIETEICDKEIDCMLIQ